MPSFRFAERAERDLIDIIDYTLKSWGVEQAAHYVDGLETSVRHLADAPKLGKACPALLDGLRAFPYQSHVLYFFEEPSGIVVLRVLHKAMNPTLHFESPEIGK